MTSEKPECRLGTVVSLLRVSLLEIIKRVHECRLTVVIEGSISAPGIYGDLKLAFIKGRPVGARFEGGGVKVLGDDAWFLTLMIANKSLGAVSVSDVNEEEVSKLVSDEWRVSDKAAEVLEPPKLIREAEVFSRKLIEDAGIKAALTVISEHINYREHVEDLAAIESVPFLVMKLVAYAKDPTYYVLGVKNSEEGEVRIVAHNGTIYAITYSSSRRRLYGASALNLVTNLTLMSGYRPTSLYVYRLPDPVAISEIFTDTAKAISKYLKLKVKAEEAKEEVKALGSEETRELASHEESHEAKEEGVEKEVLKPHVTSEIDWEEIKEFLEEIVSEVLETMGYRLVSIHIEPLEGLDKVRIRVDVKKKFFSRKSLKDVERRLKYEIRWAFLFKEIKKDFELKVKKH